ncbi:MAG: DegV family protein [Firmicutes bacterium]|nr:DegV family protein [Bacillota bacterium]
MLKIFSDTCTLYAPAEAAAIGLTVAPLQLVCGEDSWLDYIEAQQQDCLDLIAQAKIPSSSQPPIGTVVDNYNADPSAEIINVTLAHGLSGTYESACLARTMAENPQRIHVVNSQSIAGPQRYMAEMAARMAAAGESVKNVLAKLDYVINNTDSYLVVDDFDFLRRGGRLSPLVAYIGKTIKMAPAVKLSEDGKRLDMFTVKRTISKAFEAIAKDMQKVGADAAGCKFYVGHANVPKRAEQAVAALKDLFGENIDLEVLQLSPVCIAQGGPGCVSMHYIRKVD